MSILFQLTANIVIAILGVVASGRSGNEGVMSFIYIFAAMQIISGLGFGFGISSVTFLILSNFKGKKSKVNWLARVHGGFGTGVAIIAYASAAIVRLFRGDQWYIMFFIITGLLSVLLIIVFALHFHDNYDDIKKIKSGETTEMLLKSRESTLISHPNPLIKKVPIKSNQNVFQYFKERFLQTIKSANWIVIIVGFAMLFYLFVEDSGTFYLNSAFRLSFFKNNSEEVLIPIVTGLFWTGLTIGRWVLGSFVVGKLIKKKTIVTLFASVVSLITAAIFIIIFLNTEEHYVNGNVLIPLYLIAVFIFGLHCSIIYPSVASLGVEYGKSHSSRSTSYFVMMASLGGALFNVFAFLGGSGVPGEYSGTIWIPLITAPVIILFVPTILNIAESLSKKAALKKQAKSTA